ncbi:MAG: ATP-binding protein [Chloroflexota bacterium]|nr:ATP-binding protein [Chloroflexota bacterium]
MKRRISEVRDHDELFRALYQTCTEVIDATIFLLGIYDAATESVQVVRQVENGVELPGGAFALGSGFTSQVIRTRQPLLIRDWSRGPHIQVQYATNHSGLPRSSVTVPVTHADRVIAVLSVQSYRAAAYDERDMRTLQQIADIAAASITRLHASHTELDAILANLTDAVLVVDAAGRILRINHAARLLLCLEESSIVLGQAIDREHVRYAPADSRELFEMLAPMIQALCLGESPKDVDVELRTRRRVFNFSASPLRDIGGGLSGGVLLFRDVTSRREVERLKDELVSIASHDIQTPLGVIRGQAQILRRAVQRGVLGPEDVTLAASMIIGQSDRLTGLLNRLLDFSRIEAGRLELQLAPVDLRLLVDRVVQGVQSTTDRHRLRVCGPERLEGVWDDQRLAQVVENLLNNALKFSPRGGDVIVRLAMGDADSVTLSVQDFGLGLTPAALKHLFERYYRARATRRMQGTGLGLYICEGIVSAHGGRIGAESLGRNRGSTFWVILPRVAASSGLPPDASVGTKRRASSKR